MNPRRWGKQTERHYLMRTAAFEPAPVLGAEALAEEGATDARWFSVEELGGLLTGPRRLADLVADLLRNGPPTVPIDAGV